MLKNRTAGEPSRTTGTASDTRRAAVPVRGTSGELLTPPQLAERLQLPLNTLYQWRSRGLGPKGLRVGRHLRYRAEDVDDWIDEQVEAGEE